MRKQVVGAVVTLAAFVVGLPAVADEAANAEAIEDAGEADEPL